VRRPRPRNPDWNCCVKHRRGFQDLMVLLHRRRRAIMENVWLILWHIPQLFQCVEDLLIKCKGQGLP
jgi:hypothetical protein